MSAGECTVEYNKVEVIAVENAEKESMEANVAELNELQLALVGGGIGIVIVA